MFGANTTPSSTYKRLYYTFQSTYYEEKANNPRIGGFKEWIRSAMEAAEKAGERVSTAEFDVAIGPMKEAHFFSHVWAYGHHFRIMGRDLDKKTTMDSGISYIYSDSKGIGKEFVGYVERIIRVFFSPTVTSVVIKGKWWDSIVKQRGPNGTLVVDECGFSRVKAGSFMPDGSIVDEPLAFPKDLNQVFLVDDVINVGWKLFVNVNPRSAWCTYRREANDSNEDEAVEFTAQSAPGPTSARRGGRLFSVVYQTTTQGKTCILTMKLTRTFWRQARTMRKRTHGPLYKVNLCKVNLCKVKLTFCQTRRTRMSSHVIFRRSEFLRAA
jgi:hypothetical protein